MEQYINEYGKACYRGVTEISPFSEELFHEVDCTVDEDTQWAFHSDLGSLTVLHRLTGFGWWDEETGYRDPEGKFWLASGHKDVRDSKCATVGEAITWVKEYANNCVGV